VSVSPSLRGLVILDFTSRAADSRGLLPSCRGVGREPDVGQQFIDLICGMGRQATEDILEVRKGIDVVILAGAGEGVEDRRHPDPAETSLFLPVRAEEVFRWVAQENSNDETAWELRLREWARSDLVPRKES
jgi:hypothetical protein